MGYYNVSPNYKLSTSTISKSLLESTRFNQWISMQGGSTTCYSAFISVSQPQSLSLLLLLLQPQWQACACGDCVCASPVLRAANVCMYMLMRRHLDDIKGGDCGAYDVFQSAPGTIYLSEGSSPCTGSSAKAILIFWEVHLCLSVFPVTTWECAESLFIPPLCSVQWDFPCLQDLQTVFICCDLRAPWYPEKSTTKPPLLLGRRSTVRKPRRWKALLCQILTTLWREAGREFNTPMSWPLDRVWNQAMHKHFLFLS